MGINQSLPLVYCRRSATLDRLREERQSCIDFVARTLEATDADKRDLSDTEHATLETQKKRIAELDKQIKPLDEFEQIRAASEATVRSYSSTGPSNDAKPDLSGGSLATKPDPKRGTPGDQFTRSAIFTDFAAHPRGRSGTFEFDAPTQSRALPTGISDLVAAGLTSGKTHVDVTAPQPPTPLLTAVTTINVTTNAVEFVAWSKVAGGAAKVAEKAVKPSAEWAPAVTSDTLDNTAVWTQLTRQMIEDFAAVKSYIDNQLTYEVLSAEERDAAAVIAAAPIPTATGADLSTAIRVGMSTVEAAGYTPTSVLINPADAANMEIAARNGNYATDPYWGLTPIKAASATAGSPIVGDYKRAVERYTRSAIQLFITDSHAETFISNVFTLLAERRSLTAVIRPAALVEVTAATP